MQGGRFLFRFACDDETSVCELRHRPRILSSVESIEASKRIQPNLPRNNMSCAALDNETGDLNPSTKDYEFG